MRGGYHRYTGAAVPEAINVTPDGRHVFQSLSADTRVAIIGPSRRVVIGHLAVGPTPDGVAYTSRVVAPIRRHEGGTMVRDKGLKTLIEAALRFVRTLQRK